MVPVRFLSAIESDLDDAVAWYDRQQTGLGDGFLSGFHSVVRQIAEYGHVFRRVGNFRHLKVSGFPYLVFYREDADGFTVVLLIDATRDPALIQRLLGERR
jgi:hypothetical protein